jgi:hypothetical protein
MRIFLVQSRHGKYLNFRYGHLVQWESKDLADVYHTREGAMYAGKGAFDWNDDAEQYFKIVELDAQPVINGEAPT